VPGHDQALAGGSLDAAQDRTPATQHGKCQRADSHSDPGALPGDLQRGQCQQQGRQDHGRSQQDQPRRSAQVVAQGGLLLRRSIKPRNPTANRTEKHLIDQGRDGHGQRQFAICGRVEKFGQQTHAKQCTADGGQLPQHDPNPLPGKSPQSRESWSMVDGHEFRAITAWAKPGSRSLTAGCAGKHRINDTDQ
jgi:hypothetical protein